MNANARKWVEALRSGEFKQGKWILRDGDGAYCCLGVACEVYRRETGDGEWRPSETMPNDMDFVDESGVASNTLTRAVSKWVGLDSIGGAYGEMGGSLFKDNDIEDLTFSEIADVIESEPSGLFTPEFAIVVEENSGPPR